MCMYTLTEPNNCSTYFMITMNIAELTHLLKNNYMSIV